MKCPIDDSTLVIAERQGIEIDYCPDCRGVWLDRGEIDKLIDRAPGGTPEPAQQSGARPKERKKAIWLGDLFELGG